MSPPLVLIPSSKAKADGGDGRPYGGTLDDSPLGKARRTVLDAVMDAAETLDDAGVGRLCGCRPDEVGGYRHQLAQLAASPTLPAHRRYTGVVHRFAELAAVDPAAAGVEVGIVGGLLGVALLDEPVPDYRLEVTGRLADLQVLGTWWRGQLGPVLRQWSASRPVWDLLPGEFARLWPERERGDAEVVRVDFRRRDGRAAPAASAKVAKGRLLRLLIDDPGLTPRRLSRRQPLEGWHLAVSGSELTATLTG